MQKGKLEDQYVELRVIQTISDIANGVVDDYRHKMGLLDINDPLFVIIFEMQDAYRRADILLQKHVMPEMSMESMLEAEKKIGNAVMQIFDRPGLGNYISNVIDKISEEYDVRWVKPGDVIDCEHCGKKHIVGWDGSILNMDDLDEDEIKNLQSEVFVEDV